MRGTRLRLRHVVGAATLSGSLLFAALAFASLPAGAQQTTAAVSTATICPVLSVGNPSPGDMVNTGGYVISGLAFDPSATSGAGITRVDLFLGARDQGGTILGSAVPGSGNVSDPRAWSLEVTLPDVNAGADFAAYAISSVTGQETSVRFPIFVGNPTRSSTGPTPTPIPTTEVFSNTCARGAASTGAASSAAPAPAVTGAPAVSGTPAAAPAAAAAAAVAGNACPVLSLGNPSPGSLILAGNMVISGSAFVPNASQAPGMSRVDLFLGERDQGGTFLGSAAPGSGASDNPEAWSVEVTVPSLGRTVDFAAYAIGANGQESFVRFPVFVGPEPTRTTTTGPATPIPSTQTTGSSCAH